MSSKRRRTDSTRPQPSADGAAYSQKLLDLTVQTLLGAGHPPQVIARQLQNTLSRLSGSRTSRKASSMRYVSDFPHILSLWHTDPAYLDDDGGPARLALRGGAASLSSLIRRVLPGAKVADVVASLRRAKVVRERKGRYVPAGRVVCWAHEPQNTRAHATLAAVNLLKTVEHNLSCGSPRDRLLQRLVMNPAIPVRLLPSVYRKINREVQDVLKRTDTYLAHWEVPVGTEPTARVGLGVFAFQDPAAYSKRPRPAGKVVA